MPTHQDCVTSDDHVQKIALQNSKFVNNMLPEWGRFVTAVKLNRGLRDSNYDQLYNWLWGAQNIVGNTNPGQARQVKCYNCNGFSTQFDKFQADDCDAFDSDVDEAPMAQTMFMANLSSADPVYDEASPVQNLKKKLHSVKLQLASTINHNKSMVEEVTSLKKDFKQKENKYLEEFLDMKALKEKVEDRLYKQDQSLQTVHMLCKPKPYYNELNKVAIGYKNPLCLTRAKQVQPALYNGYEIVKNNHVPAIVHNTEDTLEIAEITRRKMHDKMKDPECVTHKVKIAPPDYSKENYLATFTPQKQLTPEQIFWSQDIIKMKAEALKEQTTASRPTKALMVYPPNTPATLVPRVLPIKSQVKINIFALIQLFSDFEKTCNKRITPTGLTEVERGFEQTKACYLTEVIPFFKTLKEHFEGIQKALNKEIKEMKDIFEELEVEVDQNGVDRKLDEIERKNLLIANDNLISDCFTLSELEVELSNLCDKIQKDNHDELIKRFSNLEMKASIQGKDNAIKKLRMQISQLNETRSETDRTLDLWTLDFQITQLSEKINVLQEQNELFRAENGKIKQHYKELYDSIKITRAKHLEQTTVLLTENESLKVQIQNKLSCVNKDHVKPQVLAPGKYAIDVESIPPRNRNNREVHLVYLKHLKESVETLREIVEEAKVERPLDSSLASACRYTKHSQELLEYVIGTCPKALNTRDNKHASTSLPKKKQVTFEEQCAMSKRVNSYTNASGSQPRSNAKKNRILPAKSVNMKKVEEHPRTIKSSLKTTNHVDSSISSKRTIINSNSHSVCQTCNKCLISANHDMCVVTYLHSVNASPSVKNVVRKVKQVWKPKQVKQVWKPTGNILTTVGRTDRPLVFGLRLFKTYDRGSLAAQEFRKKVHRDGQFCDSDLEVAFRKHSCYVRDTDGVELIKGSRGSNLYTISVEDMMKSSPICLLSKASKNKSWLWHRRLNHLNFGTINDLARKDLVRGLPRLKFEKDHLCSACQLGKSKKHTHKPKTKNTNLEVLNTLHMDLCGPMRVQTINGKKYILVIVDDFSRFTWVKFLRSKDETPEQNGIVKRRNCTLVEAARTMLIFSKALMFLWAEAVATACYTQNRSLIHTRHNKTLYELRRPWKLQSTADIGIFVGYAPSRKGYRIYNKRTRQIMETIHVQFDELTEQMAPVQISTGPAPSFLTHGHIISGLVPNPVPAAPYVPPINKELDILFQPMFNEYLEPPRVDRPVSPALVVPVPVNSAGTPSSTTIDQDAPSPSHSPSSSVIQSPSLHQGVAAESSLMEENPFAPVDNDPFINIFAPEPTSEASLSGDVSSAESTYVSQTLHHLKK
ncbi:retrovirus-related pol polyprotein from transposon TNT 1-94 [Tanacetum coccineum]